MSGLLSSVAGFTIGPTCSTLPAGKTSSFRCMGYVPGFEYDVFVSYASVDNESVPSADRGWVDALVALLTSGLAQVLGRREAFTHWMDAQHLRGNHEIASHIPNQVRRSALFVAVLSPGYAASKFCMLELETFVSSLAGTAERLFIVHREPLDEQRHEMPEPLRRPRKYPFWKLDKNGKPRVLGRPLPQADDPEDRKYYFPLIADLCQDIAQKLDELKKSASPEGNGNVDARVTKQAGPMVLLAEITHDPERRRDQVRRYLDQAGIPVLPARSYYGRSPAEFEQALSNDLSNCAAFVQLL